VPKLRLLVASLELVRLAGLVIYPRFESALSLCDFRLAAVGGVTFEQVQSVKVHSSI
jgi:hypothetical protein